MKMNKFAIVFADEKDPYYITYMPIQDDLKDYIESISKEAGGNLKNKLIEKINKVKEFKITKNEKPVLSWKKDTIIILDISAITTKTKKDKSFIAMTKAILTEKIKNLLVPTKPQKTTITQDQEILMDIIVC